MALAGEWRTRLWMAEWLGDKQANRTGIWQGSRRIESPRSRVVADGRGGIDDHRLHGNAPVIHRSARGYSLTVRESGGHGHH